MGKQEAAAGAEISHAAEVVFNAWGGTRCFSLQVKHLHRVCSS